MQNDMERPKKIQQTQRDIKSHEDTGCQRKKIDKERHKKTQKNVD